MTRPARDVRDTVVVFRDGEVWRWERRTVTGVVIEESPRAYPDQPAARLAALDEADGAHVMLGERLS
jgi:hypothetical protein